MVSANSSHCKACSGLSPPRFSPCWAHDLSVEQPRSRSRSRRMTNQYNDASIGRIRTRIAEVAASARRKIVLVDPRGTSQICSGCGHVVKKDLGVRVHNCPGCGLIIDRDINAAKNILNRGWACHPDPV